MSAQVSAVENAASPHLILEHVEVDIAGVSLYLHNLEGISPKPPMKTSRFTINPGCGTIDDSHEVHEIWFIMAGHLSVIYDGNQFEAHAGDALYFHPLKVHRATNVGDQEAAVVSVWWP